MISRLLIVLVLVEHLYILWIEMFAWETAGKKVFRSIPENLFSQTKGLAANQGLYNGFLAAGLLWSVLVGDHVWGSYLATFFLSCIVVAGIYGGITASRSIFFKQGVPALIALMVVLATGV